MKKKRYELVGEGTHLPLAQMRGGEGKRGRWEERGKEGKIERKRKRYEEWVEEGKHLPLLQRSQPVN